MKQIRTLLALFIFLFISVEVSAQLTAASNFVFTNIQTTQFTVSWTNGSGTGRLVTVRASPNSVSYPVDFTNYTPTSTTFGSGQNIGNNNYAVYKGTASSLTIYGLTSGSYYTVAVWEYTGTSTSPNFTTSPYGSDGQYALVAQPVTQCTALTSSNFTSSGATLSWTAGSGSRELVGVRYGTTNTYSPTDGIDYYASSIYGSGDALGSPFYYSYVVYDGTLTSVNVTGLSPQTNYTANAFTFDGTSGQNNYLLTSYPTEGFTTLASEPTAAVTNVETRDAEDDAFTLSWCNALTGGGANHLVLMNSTSSFDVPVDATIYTANSNYGSGQMIGNSYVVYNGSGNSVRVNNLSQETSYTIRVFDYNGSTGTYNPTTNYYSGYGYNYRTTNATHPIVASSGISFSSVTPTGMNMNWTAGTGMARTVTCKPGRRPTALMFDGSNDYINVPWSTTLQPSNVTLEAWAYRTNWNTSVTSQYLAGNGENGGYYMAQIGSNMYFSAYRNGGWGQLYTSVTNLTPGWHHFSMTYDGRYLRSFIDGAQYGINDAGLNASITYAYNNSFMIGADVGTASTPTASTYWSGLIDEVRVWNTARSGGNIDYDRWISLYGYESNLIGYWRMDEGMSGGSSVANTSQTLANLTGTMMNMTTAVASSYTGSSGWVWSSSPVSQPSDFYSYNASSIFGSGTRIGNNTYTIYNGFNNTASVNGLSPNSYYTFTITEYDYGSGNNYNYDTPRMYVVETQTGAQSVPTITLMSPTSGSAGTLVTITGTNFSTNANDNFVYFGATRAAVSSATATQLQVIAPYGANNNPVSVQVNGLTATYTREFNITSSCSNPINVSSFTTSTISSYGNTYGIALKDGSGDGKTDMYIAGYGSSYVNGFIGQSANGINPPTFVNYTNYVPNNSYYVEVADMDGDGKNDQIVSQLSNNTISVYRGSGFSFTGGRVDLPLSATPGQVRAADFDGDGKLDILVGYDGSWNLISVYRNTSTNFNLTFAARQDFATAGTPYSIIARDMDLDGKADIVYGNMNTNSFVAMENNSTVGNISFGAAQTFTTTGGANVMSIAAGDFNNDGKPDLAVGCNNTSVRIYQNNSTAAISFTFSGSLAVANANCYGLTCNDFDGDGRHDIAVGYSSGTTVSVFEATGNYTFAARIDYTLPGASFQLNSGDFNMDGKQDIVASSTAGSTYVLTNDLDPLASEPTTPASALTLTGQTQTAMTLNFTAGNGFSRVVVAREGSPIVNTPFDGMGYAANTVFGSGTNLGGATYCVYNGTGNSVTITGLTSNTNYYFAVYEYNSNGSGCTNNYLLTSATTSGATLNTPPTIGAISNPSAICQNSGVQVVNFGGVGTGSAGETQTLTVTAASSNPGLIPNPTVSYTSPNANGSMTYTPVVGQYGTAVITVTVNDGATNNNITTTTFTVTVSQLPSTSNAGPDQNICIGTATLAANVPTVGTGQWSVFATNDPSITNGNITNVNAANTTLNGLTTGDIVTLRWTITNGTCAPSTDNVIITMGSCPLTAQFTWAPSTICATPSQINNISFTDQSFAPSTTITSWTWTFSGPTTPNPSSSTQQNPSNIQFTGPGSFTVTLAITDNAAGNSQVTHTITIAPYPASAGAVSGTSTVCQGQTLVPFSVAAIANATSYNWTLPSGATIASGSGTNNILVDFSNVATSGFVQVQGSNTCGVGASSAPFNVTVLPLPGTTSSISGPLSVCQGQSGVVYSTSGIANATSYTWTLPPGATIVGNPNASTITVDFSANASGGTVDVVGTNSCGTGSSSVGLTISMNPLPDVAGTISGNTTVCEGTTGVVYSVPSILNATTYNWTLPPGVVITNGAGTNSITTDFTNATGSGNITVSGVNSCGTGTSANLAITVGLLPDSSTAITGPTTVCAGATGVQYSVTSITGASNYNWTLPVGATIVVDNGNSITVDFSPTASSGPVTVYGTNVCGNGAMGPGITLTVNPLPDTTTTISGPATVCEGDTAVVFTVPAAANATDYIWSLPVGAIVTAGANTNSITVTFNLNSQSGAVYVNGNNACGTGVAADTLQVTVNPLPVGAGTVSGPGNIAICPAATGVTFTVPAITNATTYTWNLPAGSTIVSGSGTNTITVDFVSSASSGAVVVYGVNGCGSGDSAFLNFAVDAVTPVDICMVTVDGPSNWNNIMWEKPTATDIDSFRIYREITSNTYQVVGTVDYDSLSLFVDSIYVPIANPNTTFQRYKISAIDSCGNESPLSNHHRTLFMQASIGVGGEANLNWTMYEGQTVDYYRILRDSTLAGNWEVIDSVPGTNFVYTDWTPPVTVTQCRYRIQTVWQVSCTPTRNINTSESNLEDLIVNGVNDHNASFPVQLYPNPTTSLITIVTPSSSEGITYEVMDATGRIVMAKKENSGSNGSQVTQLDLSGLADGAYTIVITAGDLKQHEKVILQK